MASYPTQILDAPPQYGFIPGLASGMSSAGQTFGNAYMDAMIKDKFAKKKTKQTQEEMNKWAEAMKQGGYEIDSSTMDENGNVKYTFKKKETPESKFTDAYSKDPEKIIKRAMGGMLPGAQMEQLGQAQGIPRQQPMNPYQAAMANEAILSPAQQRIAPAPAGPMGLVNLPTAPVRNPQLTGPMSAIGEPMDYGRTVQKSLMKDLAPGYSEQQVKRDVMGLPTETPAEKLAAEQAKIPESFTDDVKSLKDIAKGDAEVFVAGLERLALKYTDNPDVLNRIKLIRTIFSGQEPAEFKPDVTLQ